MKAILATITALALLTQAWAAKDVDFSELEGSYKGKGTVSAFGMTYPLTAKVTFTPSKNGSSAKVKFSGLVAADSSVPWGTTLKLKKNGKFTTSNVFAVDVGGGALPGSGRFKLPKTSKLEGESKITLPPDNVVAQTVTMVVEPKGKTKKRLEVKLVVVVNGAPYYTYLLSLTGK